MGKSLSSCFLTQGVVDGNFLPVIISPISSIANIKISMFRLVNDMKRYDTLHTIYWRRRRISIFWQIGTSLAFAVDYINSRSIGLKLVEVRSKMRKGVRTPFRLRHSCAKTENRSLYGMLKPRSTLISVPELRANWIPNRFYSLDLFLLVIGCGRINHVA